MKNKKVLVSIILLLIIVILLGPQSVTANAIKTPFTGTETPCGTLDPGTWVDLPNGGRHLRGMISTSTMDSTDDRMSGTATVLMNANLDPSGTGPFWGSFVLEVETSEGCPGGGSWQGTYAGKISYTQFYAYYHAVIQGVSGCVEGMKASIDADVLLGSYEGTILDPHGE